MADEFFDIEFFDIAWCSTADAVPIPVVSAAIVAMAVSGSFMAVLLMSRPYVKNCRAKNVPLKIGHPLSYQSLRWFAAQFLRKINQPKRTT
jgi:hypothetical protein